jgi:hypothetical protein
LHLKCSVPMRLALAIKISATETLAMPEGAGCVIPPHILPASFTSHHPSTSNTHPVYHAPVLTSHSGDIFFPPQQYFRQQTSPFRRRRFCASSQYFRQQTSPFRRRRFCASSQYFRQQTSSFRRRRFCASSRQSCIESTAAAAGSGGGA